MLKLGFGTLGWVPLTSRLIVPTTSPFKLHSLHSHISLKVPCCGFFGAKRNNGSCLGCFVCCSCCGGCLHVIHAILMILLLVALSSVETVCRRNGSCVGIMKACEYRKSHWLLFKDGCAF